MWALRQGARMEIRGQTLVQVGFLLPLCGFLKTKVRSSVFGGKEPYPLKPSHQPIL